MSADDERLAPLIESIGDDAPVNWARWEADATDAAERDLLATLRRVQSLAAFSRARQREAAPASCIARLAVLPSMPRSLS